MRSFVFIILATLSVLDTNPKADLFANALASKASPAGDAPIVATSLAIAGSNAPKLVAV